MMAKTMTMTMTMTKTIAGVWEFPTLCAGVDERMDVVECHHRHQNRYQSVTMKFPELMAMMLVRVHHCFLALFV